MESGGWVDSITDSTFSPTSGMLPVIRESIFDWNVGDVSIQPHDLVAGFLIPWIQHPQPCFSPSNTTPIKTKETPQISNFVVDSCEDFRHFYIYASSTQNLSIGIGR